MKLFETALANCAFLGVQWDENSQKFFYTKKYIITQSLCTACIVFTFLFLIYNAESFVEYIDGLFIFSSAILCCTVLMSVHFKLSALSDFIKNCKNVINTRMEYSESKIIFGEPIEKVDKWSKIITLLSQKMIPVCGVFSRLVPSFFSYFVIGSSGDEAFNLPVPMWFPFDWKNPFGYLTACSIQFAIAYYGFTLLAALCSLALAGSLLAHAGTEFMKKILQNISKCAKVKRNLISMLNHLSKFIKVHSETTQDIKYFSDVYQPIVATLFSWSLISGSMALIQLEIMSQHEMDLFVMIVITIEAVCSFGLVFLSCELGERFSAEFDGISNVIGKFRWYKFPIEVQRMLPTIILIGQQPVAIECFGSLLCVRTTLKSVTKTAFSYFTVLRQFDF